IGLADSCFPPSADCSLPVQFHSSQFQRSVRLEYPCTISGQQRRNAGIHPEHRLTSRTGRTAAIARVCNCLPEASDTAFLSLLEDNRTSEQRAPPATFIPTPSESHHPQKELDGPRIKATSDCRNSALSAGAS